MLDLQPIKDRLAAATPGPWSFDSSKGDCRLGYGIISHYGTGIKPGKKVCNVLPLSHEEHKDCDENVPGIVRLVVNAPTDLAALVAEVERLRTAIANHKRRVVIDPQPWDRDLWEVLQ